MTRSAENVFLENDYYRGTVMAGSFLIFMMTFLLIVLLSRLIASLSFVLDYAFQSLEKVKPMETERKETEPSSAAGPERRKYPRFDVYWPVQYHPMGSPGSHQGRVTNLSEGGMVIQSPGQMEIGQHLKSKVSFILGSEIDTIELQAEVVWRDLYLSEALKGHRCGAKFLDISARDKTKLNHLLMSLSRSSPYSS
jgi:hypothetical protein